MDYYYMGKEVNHKVLILLSAYNGSDYLLSQIGSILCQEKIDIQVIIRDDGSTDNTLGIINKNFNSNNRIHLLSGKNVGFVESFLKLAYYAIQNYSDVDYFAFADQDDVWYPSKLSEACFVLDQLPSEIPNVFCCNSDLIDSEGRIIGKFKEKYPRYTRGNVIYYGTFQGCSMVFNRAALQEFVNHPPISAFHDRWLYLICHFLGNTVYDHMPLFGYRIHGDNQVGTKVKSDSLMTDIMKISRSKVNKNKQVIAEFCDSFGSRIRGEDKQRIDIYNSYPHNLINKIWLIFLPSFGPREVSYRGIVGHIFRVFRNEL